MALNSNDKEVFICFSFSTISDAHLLAKQFNAKIAKASYEILHNKEPDALKDVVFPNSYSNVMLKMPQGIAFCPMRYRLRPFDSESEVPTKYNLYNARVETLLEKQTWGRLLGRKHVAVPLTKFHEWVPTENGKKVVQFKIPSLQIFWVAGLFDIWKGEDQNSNIISFALITQEPNDYIQSVGHDRCPIIIDENETRNWLEISQQATALEFLTKKRDYEFSHEWEDPMFTIAQQVKFGKIDQ